jgi:hypothetical protein
MTRTTRCTAPEPLVHPASHHELATARHAILATENSDGSAHLVPVLFRRNRICIRTAVATRKARKVAANDLAGSGPPTGAAVEPVVSWFAAQSSWSGLVAD